MKNSLLYEIKSTIYHLRFKTSFALLPVFLWGYVLTEADITVKFLYGILILHLLVYSAGNGLYAYFDTRKGIISGVRDVKPASSFTLAVSLILLVIGIYLSFKVNATYFYIVLLFSILFFLYSHPGFGIKSKPFYGILFISISYGLLGFLAGWVCAVDLKGLLDIFNIGGAIASIGFVAGFYLLSLIYRISEDSDRTDDLFIERLGSVRAFKIAKIILPISWLITTIVVAGKFTLYELIGVIIYLSILFLIIDRFEKNFYLQKEWQNYRTIMGINLTNSLILSLYLLFRIFAVHYLFID